MSKKRTRQPRNNSAQASLSVSVREQNAMDPVAVHQQVAWSGPIPPPNQLAEFEAIIPGSAERILKMAEQEGEHTREIQRRAVIADIRSQYLGQIFGLIFSLGTVIMIYWLAMAGHEVVASILAGATLATVSIAFIGQKKQREQPPIP